MKRIAFLLLAALMVLSLCACNIAKPPVETQPQSDPTEATQPEEIADPVGTYRCIAISLDGPEAYEETDHGKLCLYADGTGDVYFDENYYDFDWEMEDDRFLAAVHDMPEISLEGTLEENIMVLVHEKTTYLRFQRMTKEELEKEALDLLRYMMEDTKEQMAAAYLGWLEPGEDLQTWLAEKCPELQLEYPILTSIPQERIVGDSGEVYCLVPRDPQAKLTINLLKDNAEGVQDVLYESEDGQPVLLLCNNGESYPNTQVVLTESTGGELTWKPLLGDAGGVCLPTDDMLDEQMLDFSNYMEVYQDEYVVKLIYGWQLPDEAYLSSACWNYQEDTPEERRWVLDLREDGTLELDLIADGAFVKEEHYAGTWSLNFSDNDGLTWLYLDMLRADGTAFRDACVVMKSEYEVSIVLGVRNGQGRLPVPCEEEISYWQGSLG